MIFANGTAIGAHPMTWLRVAADAPWLVRAPSPSEQVDPLDGSYEAHPLSAVDGHERRYLPDATHSVRSRRRTLSGDHRA